MARSRADVREADLLQKLADGAFVIDDAEAFLDDVLQVDPPPTDDAILRSVGPRFDDLEKGGQLLGESR